MVIQKISNSKKNWVEKTKIEKSIQRNPLWKQSELNTFVTRNVLFTMRKYVYRKRSILLHYVNILLKDKSVFYIYSSFFLNFILIIIYFYGQYPYIAPWWNKSEILDSTPIGYYLSFHIVYRIDIVSVYGIFIVLWDWVSSWYCVKLWTFVCISRRVQTLNGALH